MLKETYTREAAEHLVAIAYAVILLRAPDPQGADSAANNLLSGTADMKALLESLLQSEEFAQRQVQFLQNYIKPDRRRLLLDHTQNGEFHPILEFLMARGQVHKIIVDVGARGRERSNSYDLLKHFGWRGLLVEANPTLHAPIRDDFAGTLFDLEGCAVSDYEGTAEFYFGVNDDVSSLNHGAAAGWGAIQGKTTVTVHTLATVLDKHAIPEDFDILSLDIEGEDVKAFNALIGGSRYRPRLALIEVGPPRDPPDLAALGFSADVLRDYAFLGHYGPNVFLTRNA